MIDLSLGQARAFSLILLSIPNDQISVSGLKRPFFLRI